MSMDESKTGRCDPVVLDPEDANALAKESKGMLASMTHAPELMLVTGLPGCGKTTTLRFMKEAFGDRIAILSMGNVIRAYLKKDIATLCDKDLVAYQQRCDRVREGMKKFLVNSEDVHFILESAIQEAWEEHPGASIVLDGVPRSENDLKWVKTRFPVLVKRGNSGKTGTDVTWLHLTVPGTKEAWGILAARISGRDASKGHARENGTTDMDSARNRIQKESVNMETMFKALATMNMAYVRRVEVRSDVECSAMLCSIATRLSALNRVDDPVDSGSAK